MNVVNALFAYGSSVPNNSAQISNVNSNNFDPTSDSMDGVQSNAEEGLNLWVDRDQAHANDLSATTREVDQEMGGDNLQAMGEQVRGERAMGDEAAGNEAMRDEATRDEDMQDATATSGSKDSESEVEGGKVASPQHSSSCPKRYGHGYDAWESCSHKRTHDKRKSKREHDNLELQPI